jgi:hypothetical protein
MKFRYKTLGLLATALLALSATAFSEELYKTIDANGHVTYSDQPPMNPSQAKTSTIHSTGPSDPNAPQELQKEIQNFNKQQQEKADAQKKADEKAAQEKERLDECKRIQANLRTLQSKRSLYTVDENNKRVAVSQASRESEINRMNNLMKQYKCQ